MISNSTPSSRSFVDILRLRATLEPQRLAFGFERDHESAKEQITYGELDQRARAIAVRLQAEGLRGRTVLLLIPSGLRYVEALFGCLYAGAVAVPAYLPRFRRKSGRLERIIQDSQAGAVLLQSSREVATDQMPWHPFALLRIVTGEINSAIARDWRDRRTAPDELALLQYTSGSTASPRGVMLSHANLLHNSSLLSQTFGYHQGSRCVSWLPLHHDMGLIGSVLQPVHGGFPCWLMDPATFVRHPKKWLEAISEHRATVSGGPNFAYDLCVRKIQDSDIETLDLSHWEIAFNGAEPVRAETLLRFAEKFERWGFRREAQVPCYGMAEATLLITASKNALNTHSRVFDEAALKNRKLIESRCEGNCRSLVSCGYPPEGMEIAIVAPDTCRLAPDGEIGEIWIAGDSVAQGYYCRTEETETTFGARLADGSRRYLRTGDLGCIYRGELYVIGRLKDLIIIRGQNHYPQDIEITVENSHPRLRAGCGGAFSIELEGEEKLVIVQEFDGRGVIQLEQVTQAIRAAVVKHHELEPHAVVLIKSGTIPKTSSGKIQRHACRTAYLESNLEIIHSDVSENLTIFALSAQGPSDVNGEEVTRDAIESILVNAIATVRRVLPKDIDRNQSIYGLGLDSLAALELNALIESALSVRLALSDLPEADSVREAADKLLDLRRASAEPRKISRTPGNILPALSLEQERFWFLQQLKPETTRYNLAATLRLSGILDYRRVVKSLNRIAERHESLRMSFVPVKSQPQLRVEGQLQVALPVIDLSTLPENRREPIISTFAETGRSEPFDLATRPLVRFKLIRISRSEHVLIFITHHIVCDAWSIRIFIHEFAELYQGRSLPDLTIGYSDFASWQRMESSTEEATKAASYWKTLLDDCPSRLRIRGSSLRTADCGSSAEVTFEVPAKLAERLKDRVQAEGVTLHMYLLACLQLLLYRCSGQNEFLIASPALGRPLPETRGLIGLFAYPLPFRSRVSGLFSFQQVLLAVRHQALEAYEYQDIPLASVLRALKSEENSPYAQLGQVLFTVIGAPPLPESQSDVRFSPPSIQSGTQGFDLFLMFIKNGDGLTGKLAYDPELFNAEIAAELAKLYVQLIEKTLAYPDQVIEQLHVKWPPDASSTVSGIPQFNIAGTFTAEPVAPPLLFWTKELNLQFDVHFAPQGRIFDQLLDSNSLFAANKSGINVILLRLEDWSGKSIYTEGEALSALALAEIERNTQECVLALKEFVSRCAAPVIVCVCPSSPVLECDSRVAAEFRRMEAGMERDFRSFANVTIVTSAELARLYPVQDYYDPFAYETARIPYTTAMFAAIGTALARKMHAVRAVPYKVIAVDCDQTLWKGFCGEDGPSRIRIDETRQVLQAKLVEQRDAGMLICLCSRNIEEDVWNVFDHNAEMPLRREHIIAHRINWRPKSENLRDLAGYLSLNLESFVFLDDNPAECAEVLANCPEVLTLTLPAADDQIPRFLEHIWAFDRPHVTLEDRLRGDLYRDEARRRIARKVFPSYQAFLDSLALEVRIQPTSQNQLPRLSQLTYRTNQFNTTAMRLTESDIVKLCQSSGYECLGIEVTDRFGNYGLVGLALFVPAREGLVIESFLLSCRVLGRGVEHRVARELGELAARRGLSQIGIRFRSSPRNGPALTFLRSVGEHSLEGSEQAGVFWYSAPVLVGAIFHPAEPAEGRSDLESDEPAMPTGDPRMTDRFFQRIADELNDAGHIADAVRLANQSARVPPKIDEPRTPTERRLAEIWEEVLGARQFGIHDSFFDLGGHSLLAMQVLARLNETFGFQLPLSVLFDGPLTIAELAQAIEEYELQHADINEVSAAIDGLNGLLDEEVRVLLANTERTG